MPQRPPSLSLSVRKSYRRFESDLCVYVIVNRLLCRDLPGNILLSHAPHWSDNQVNFSEEIHDLHKP